MQELQEFLAYPVKFARRSTRRIIRKLPAARGAQIPSGFFDGFTRFYSTSVTGGSPNRLNQRYLACIKWNEQAIQGKRILDLASHDGRWSFAAIKAGAANVVGIEARNHLVQAAVANLRVYQVADNSFRFVQGDIFECIDQIEPYSIDTVFCLGIFYHVADHMLLLSKIARLKPKHLILDTEITSDSRCYEGAAFRGGDASPLALVGKPSKAALELMLSSFGWNFTYYDWRRSGINRWDSLEEYHEGVRVTLRVNCAH
jgi:hypothetical protein